MQMNKYLETYHIKDIINYCQSRCIKIVNEDLNNKVLAPETFVQLAGVNPYSQPKSIRTLSRRNFVQNGL